MCAACSSKPPLLLPDSAASDNPAVEKEFKAARSLFDNGKKAQAEAAFEKLILDHPKDPLARVSTIYRARIQLGRNNPQKARSLLAPIKGDEDSVSERAAFYDGVALYKLEAYKEALNQLTQFVDRLTDLDENLLLLECLWKAASEIGDLDKAVTWLDSYLKHAPAGDLREHAVISLEGLVDEIDQTEQLEELGSSLEPNGSAWPLVMARLAKLQFESGELKKATQVLEKVDAQQRGDEQAVQEMASTIKKHVSVDFRSIGCIVPLSGRSRLIGEEVLKGVMLGAKAIPLGEDN